MSKFTADQMVNLLTPSLLNPIKLLSIVEAFSKVYLSSFQHTYDFALEVNWLTKSVLKIIRWANGRDTGLPLFAI